VPVRMLWYAHRMYVEKRRSGQKPTDWAKNLGIDHVRTTLSQATALRFRLAKVAEPLWREVRSFLKPGQSVLDAGCGMGHWVRFLSSRGMAAAGLDYSSEIIRVLKQEFPEIAWYHGQIQDIPCAESQFDHVISWGVVEHDEHGPDLALQEFSRVIRDGGYCFITTPADTELTRRSSRVQFEPNDPDARFFQYFFTPSELAERVRNAGFEVVLAKTIAPAYTVAFPELSLKVMKHGRIARRLVDLLTQPLARLNHDWDSTSVVIGRKISAATHASARKSPLWPT